MPRRARLTLPNVPLHLIQRGNNRQACFFADEDYRFYLDWLNKHARQTGCAVHTYVLMSNHAHWLISTTTASSAGAMMKALEQCNAQIREPHGCGMNDTLLPLESITRRISLLRGQKVLLDSD